MSTFERRLAAFAAFLLALATGFGAYASHGLAGVLSTGALHSVELAINYQFFHALGLLILATIMMRGQSSLAIRIAALTIGAGVALFCGGIYASSFNGPALLSQFAPIGGTALMAGWLLAGITLWRQRATP
jgi:uncharacterized membrane protein YgdD (TMEM256/DUF423 family)